MRICFISHQSQLEGAERSLLGLIKSLKARGIWAGVAIMKGEGPLMNALDQEGVPWASIKAPWWTRSFDRPEYPAGPIFSEIISASNRLMDLVLHWNADIIYSNTAVTGVGALAASGLGKPHIWHIRESAAHTESYKYLVDLGQLAGFIEKRSSHIIFNSNAVRDAWTSEFKTRENGTVVYNSVETADSVGPAVDDHGVDVIIPMHNDTFILKCLSSLLTHRSESLSHIYILDDMTSDSDLVNQVKTLASQNSDLVTYSRNSEHLGFVGTCNRGMRLSGNDVVLLNSDTLVTDNWLEELRNCAHHDMSVATVTPLSNNASLVSIPELYQNNDIDNPDQISRWLKHLAPEATSELPTAHGFCVYIKRSAIEKVGLFDVETFGHGYGEENDYSLRLNREGYKNIASCRSFVYHKGAQSFGQEKRERLISENLKVIKERYPQYSQLLKDFRSSDPFSDIREPLRRLIKQPELDDTFRIAMVGTITRWKQQLDGVKAFHHLKKKGYPVSLWICGPVKDQDYMDEITDYITRNGFENDVLFLGQLKNPAGIFAFCDISIVCSHFEPFGRVTLESMLCGTPVVGADGGGTRELITEGVNGRLYEPGNCDDLANQIEYFINHPDDLKKVSESANSWALQFNDSEKRIRSVYNIINQSVSDPVEQMDPLSCFTKHFSNY